MASISLHQFRFYLGPKALLRIPAYKGNIIHGGFGSTFRRNVYHANCRDPEGCELRKVCPYTAVFQPFVPEGSEKISKNGEISRCILAEAKAVLFLNGMRKRTMKKVSR